MITNVHWNAIYTRPNCERKVCKLLDKKQVVYFFAENQVKLDITDQAKMVTVALFPSIIFVQADNNTIATLTQLPDVTNFVYWQQHAAVFPVGEIDLLRNFLEVHETVQLVKTDLNIAGQLNPQPTANYQLSTDQIYSINLPSIGYSLWAHAEPVLNNVKLVRKNTSNHRNTDSLAFILGFKIARK